MYGVIGMTRKEFYERYAKRAGISKAKSAVLCKSVLNFMAECVVREDRLCIVDFGTFKKKNIKSHRVYDINNPGEYINVPEKQRIVFEITPSVVDKYAHLPTFAEEDELRRITIDDIISEDWSREEEEEYAW